MIIIKIIIKINDINFILIKFIFSLIYNYKYLRSRLIPKMDTPP
jgi:hypothetical protein